MFSRSLHLSCQYGVSITGQISQKNAAHISLKRNRTSAVWDGFYLLQHASLPAAVLQVGQQFVQRLGDVNMLVRLSIAAEGCEHQSQTQHTASSEGEDRRERGQEKGN